MKKRISEYKIKLKALNLLADFATVITVKVRTANNEILQTIYAFQNRHIYVLGFLSILLKRFGHQILHKTTNTSQISLLNMMYYMESRDIYTKKR